MSVYVARNKLIGQLKFESGHTTWLFAPQDTNISFSAELHFSYLRIAALISLVL